MYASEDTQFHGGVPCLGDELEDDFVSHCLSLEERYFGLTMDDLRRLAFPVGRKKWHLSRLFENRCHGGKKLPTYLSSSGPVAHKAEVNLLHLVLSAATRLASFQLFHPSIRLSFSIVDRHVVFGRPTFLYLQASRSVQSHNCCSSPFVGYVLPTSIFLS